jgi:hypothetical protein
MATLDQTRINQIWQKPKNREAIQRADVDNQRQLFHAQLSVDRDDSNAYLNVYLDKIRSILQNDDKFAKFESLLQFPLVSNHLISKGTDEWNKVFKAQDRVEEYRFSEDKMEIDFRSYLEKINFRDTIEQNLFTKVKQAVNTVGIVDIPTLAEGQSETEPYVYFVETGKLHDVDVDHTGTILYVMFERGNRGDDDHRVVIIDGEYYRIAKLLENSNDLLIEVENRHELGYCPAVFLWKDVRDPDKPIRRYNSVLEIVDQLDEYLMWKTFGDHVDLYSSFPIIWKYGNSCENDVEAKSEAGVPIMYDLNGVPIPKQKSDYIGPGWMVDIEIPDGESATLAPPVGFVDPKAVLLEYNRNKIRQIEVKIIKHLTGVDNEIQNEKAFNESQIRSQYETRNSVLRYWAENMQAVHWFFAKTIAKQRYGDKFLGGAIDYGQDYFLYDTITADTDYKGAKDAGLPQYIIMARRAIVEQIETRNSPNKQARFEILSELEPYVDVNLTDLDPLTQEYELKANFQLYINRFEREHVDIVKFGSEIDFDKKIRAIQSKLYDYVRETRVKQEKAIRRGTDVRQPGQGQTTSVSEVVA